MRRAPERSSGEDQISAPKTRVWRRYTPHKTSENGGRPHRTSPSRLAPMGPNFQIHVTNPLSNRMVTCGLRGPLSAVLGPCVDSCYCCCIPVWRTCHSRWNARMGPKMGGQLDDPPDSRGGESRLHRTTFQVGGDTPLTKNTLKTAVGTVGPYCADLH